MELFLAFLDPDLVVQGTPFPLSSSLRNVVHNFGLNSKGVVTDVTVLPVPGGRVRHADVVSALRSGASFETESECIVLVTSAVNQAFNPAST